MKNYLKIAGLIIIIIIFFIYEGGNHLFNLSTIFEKKCVVDLQLHGEYQIDTSRIREFEYIKESAPFTFFINTHIDYSMEGRLLSLYDLVLPEELVGNINFEDSNTSMLLSFGRKLKEVKCISRGWNWENKPLEIFEITFCEEYNGDIMYAYLIDRKLYSTLQETYYIMSDSKRILLGKSLGEINEKKQSPSGQQGV